jgi:hypothetical protein
LQRNAPDYQKDEEADDEEGDPADGRDGHILEQQVYFKFLNRAPLSCPGRIFYLGTKLLHVRGRGNENWPPAQPANS